MTKKGKCRGADIKSLESPKYLNAAIKIISESRRKLTNSFYWQLERERLIPYKKW